MRAIQLLAAAIVLAAPVAVAEKPEYPGYLWPEVGSPRGYLHLITRKIPADARVRLIESEPAGGARVAIPQRIVRPRTPYGAIVVALRGLDVDKTYDVEIIRPGHRPLLARAAYRTEHPTLSPTALTHWNRDRCAGPGQHLLLCHASSGRRIRVEVGGMRARIAGGPWDLAGRIYDPDPSTEFVVPKLPPGPAEVVVSDEAGWIASAGWIEVLPERREVSFRARGRRFRTLFQEARGGTNWFSLRTYAWSVDPNCYFHFSMKSDVRSATLPATYTHSSPDARLLLEFQRRRGARYRMFEEGEWTLTIEEVADGEVRGTFSARMIDERKPHGTVEFKDGQFLAPLVIYD